MKKFIKIGILCLILGGILEIGLFNFRTWESINYKSTDLTNEVNVHGFKNTNGVYSGKYDKDNYIEIKSINKKVKNIKLDIKFDDVHKYLNYTMSFKDEANKYYKEMPGRILYPSIEKSKYVTLKLSGKTKSIKIRLDNPKYTFYDFGDSISFKINSISINEKIPFDISYTRLLLVSLVIFILYCIRPKSEFYKYKLDFKNKYQIGIILAVFVMIALSFFYIADINPHFKNPGKGSNYDQYHDLTKALSKGQVYLDDKVSNKLKKMDNPYDTMARQKENVKHMWDRAYYKGKYYVYFGVVPVITTYLPIYLLTGKMMKDYLLIYIISFITTIGMFLFLKEIVKKYFKNISFLTFIVIFSWMCASLYPILEYPTLYNIPIVYALMFMYFGLYFFLSSIKEKDISKVRIFLGSLCMALIAGCRPQLLLSSFLAIPIFWDSIKQRKLFSKKSIWQTVLAIIPYVVVAILLMYYNKIRFGSIVDFGANYNLTGNDMTKRAFNFDRIGLGLFYLLFALPIIKPTFPFLGNGLFVTNYMGTTIAEINFGGLLTTNLLLFLGLFFYKFKDKLPKKLFYMSIVSVISFLVILIVDIEGAGIVPRYMTDFSWGLLIPSVFVILSIFNSGISKNAKKVIWSFILICVCINFLYIFVTMFNDYIFYEMINTNTEFYFKWYYLLQWWL